MVILWKWQCSILLEKNVSEGIWKSVHLLLIAWCVCTHTNVCSGDWRNTEHFLERGSVTPKCCSYVKQSRAPGQGLREGSARSWRQEHKMINFAMNKIGSGNLDESKFLGEYFLGDYCDVK